MRFTGKIKHKLGGWPRGVLERVILRAGVGQSGPAVRPAAMPRLLLGAPSSARPPGTQAMIARADLACEHRFTVFGDEPQPAGRSGPGYQRIHWHVDPASGHGWDPRKNPIRIRVGSPQGVDILGPWELSRMQHLVQLGQAYAITGHPKYALEYRDQITDWIDANPRFRGVNWMSSMEAALRAVSWLVGLDFFPTAPQIQGDRRFLLRLHRSLHDHGRFIRVRSRLKKLFGQDGSNHHVAAMAGLLFISVYCPFFTESADWRRFALGELLKCARTQVLEDGCDYEASTSYHLLVLECLFYSLVLCERAGLSGLDPLRDTVKRMFESGASGGSGGRNRSPDRRQRQRALPGAAPATDTEPRVSPRTRGHVAE